MRTVSPKQTWRAFTLIELLVVITIMIFIATITLINVFGAMRGSGYASVSRDVFGALMNARQHACQSGNRTHFFLIDSNRFVLAYSMGTITDIPGGNAFRDKYANLDANITLYQGVKMFDLDANAMAYIFSSKLITYATNSIIDGVNVWIPGGPPNGSTTPPSPGQNVYTLPELQMTVQKSATDASAPPFVLPPAPYNPNAWNIGDHYAFEAGEEQELPKGFYFSRDSANDTVDPNQPLNSFEFMPDGSVVANGSGNGLQMQAGSPCIKVFEAIKSQVASVTNVIFVVDSSGQISRGD